MKGNVELLNLFWTTAGMFPGEGEISHHEIKDRVEAATGAGFKGIGLWHTDLEHLTVHRTLEEIRRLFDDNGVEHLELEFLTDWFLEGARRRESDNRRRRLLVASEVLGAHHIKIGDFYRTECPMAQLTEAFAGLCEEAEDYGATIAFEFMSSSVVSNLRDSLTMVTSAGAPNGGLAVDISHMVNLGIPFDDLGLIPREHLISLELNDGTLPGTPGHDPSARRFCGEGAFDIRGFIDSAQGAGYTGPWALEVFNRELTGLPLGELNRRAFETTIAQFSR